MRVQKFVHRFLLVAGVLFSLSICPFEASFQPAVLDETDLTAPAGSNGLDVSGYATRTRRRSRARPRAIASIPFRAVRKLRRMVWAAKMERFHSEHRLRPAPLETCIELQKSVTTKFGDDDLFLPASSKVVRKGKFLRDAELADRMGAEDFGGWSPPVDVMDWIVEYLETKKPRAVLEFGGGRTTACLCMVLTRIHGPDGFRILTLDQELENVERTTNRLAGLPGRASCRIVHVPIVPANAGSRETSAYDVAGIDPVHFDWLGKADLVFVDGPYAAGPCRYGTLPEVRERVAPSATFLMDDALREKELFAGLLWKQQGIHIEGVLTLGQGVMIGSL